MENLESRTQGMSNRARKILASVPMVLSHASNFGYGLYTGIMKSEGFAVDFPPLPLLLANSATTAAFTSVKDTPKKEHPAEYMQNAWPGMIFGPFYSIVEYNIGKMIGFYGNRLKNI